MNSNRSRIITPWKTQKSELVLNNRWAKVRRDECELPNGEVISDYYYWEGGDFAQVFALTADKEVVMTRQYKHGAKDVVIELPAGLVDWNEIPLSTARRELKEETGFDGDPWAYLGEFNVSSAKATTKASAFLVTNAKRVGDPVSTPNEQIETFLLPLPQLLDWVSAGKIRDVNSISTTFLALQRLGLIRREF